MATQFSARQLWSHTFSAMCAGTGLVVLVGGLWLQAFVLIGGSTAYEAMAARHHDTS